MFMEMELLHKKFIIYCLVSKNIEYTKYMSLSNFRTKLDSIINLLNRLEPVCVIRPSDGEYMVLQGMDFKNIDNWHFSGKGLLKDELDLSIKKGCELNNCFIGIPCSCCNKEIELWYKNNYKLNESNITFANLFCNSNWQPFISFLIENKFRFYFIGPPQQNSELNIVDSFEIPQYLVNTYDTDGSSYYTNIKQWVSVNDGPFFFACGPISKIWAVNLYKEFPNKSFIDIGSSLDIFIKGTTNRQYCYPNQIFSTRVCYFS